MSFLRRLVVRYSAKTADFCQFFAFLSRFSGFIKIITSRYFLILWKTCIYYFDKLPSDRGSTELNTWSSKLIWRGFAPKFTKKWAKIIKSGQFLMNSPFQNAFIFLRMIEISSLVLKWPSRAAINRQKAKKGDCSIESSGEKECKI